MIEDAVGHVYGPRPYRTDESAVAAYRAAVGLASDGPPPPALAGAMLFAVAPEMLSDERIGEDGRSVVHGEQTFSWHGGIPAGATLSVSGEIVKARRRGDVTFTTFELSVSDETGRHVVDGTSLFLMSSGSATGAQVDEAQEPGPLAGSLASHDPGGPTGRFSASRADLVRYAGASADWNPIHWDHDTAVEAGLSGVVVHGLLQSAWMLTVAGAVVGADPATARFRYRAPLRPAVEVEVTGSVDGDVCSLELASSDAVHVTATVGTT